MPNISNFIHFNHIYYSVSSATTITENGTYISNSGYPSTVSGASDTSYSLCASNSQVKLFSLQYYNNQTQKLRFIQSCPYLCCPICSTVGWLKQWVKELMGNPSSIQKSLIICNESFHICRTFVRSV